MWSSSEDFCRVKNVNFSNCSRDSNLAKAIHVYANKHLPLHSFFPCWKHCDKQITHLISCYKCLAKFFWVKVVILYKTFFFQNSEAISATSKITYFFLILCSPIDGMARYGSSMAHSFSCLNIIFLSWCSLELMGPNFFVFSFFAKNEKKTKIKTPLENQQFCIFLNQFYWKFQFWLECAGDNVKLWKIIKRGTELLPGLNFAKINFFIFKDMVKSLEHDVSTIIISNFD